MSDTPNNWTSLWEHRDLLLGGLGTTVLLFVLAATASFVLGCMLAWLLEGRDNAPRRTLRLGINALRMLPFLIFIYLLYYGLPSLGIRLEAWDAGLLGLSCYYAAYYAEVLRGARLVLPTGSLDAAYAHGYRRGKAFLRIVLPQLVMRTRGESGNLLIMCLKDTSFLGIITVTELTAAANAMSSRYFIPMEAFVLVLALYWALGITVDALMRRFGRYGRQRGLEYE
ncbi:ABC transporter permease [Hylemonella gracilis str. Niagara R]|uniref:ABC transporter permease n=1 Tax=Hylemonella gracilis str. Niagara R TaxID=1458275 RepID=A0A016XF47_9BURK|nr:amino acid ABC transporter permease [Hylemonella gracilis]EYC50182.1 ABC transporter permease [Hylemonella gracilis str. Niagara R]